MNYMFYVSALDKLLEILSQSYNESETNTAKSNIYLAFLIAIVDVSTTHVIKNFSANEVVSHIQRKWLEVLIDFILNITENKKASVNEYINSFNYNKFHSIDTLKFLYNAYQKSTIIEYFLAACLPYCASIRIGKFLLQYIERIQIDLIDLAIEKNESVYTKLNSIGVYIQNVILSNSRSSAEMEFDQNENDKINNLIKKLLDMFLTSFSGDKESKYTMLGQCLTSLTECLFCLYDEDSIYYDEQNLLESLLKDLDLKLKTKHDIFDFSNPLSKIATSSLVYLTCLAYKSNLIKNENVTYVYEFIKQVCQFRFLYLKRSFEA